MTYRIPSPWNPGYAVPAHVKAEGLRMRAFVTRMKPRGTYDHIPDANTLEPAWAVPQYVKDEGYGQGTYVTQWPPRGYYVGEEQSPRAKAQVAAEHPRFAKFGQRAAKHILTQISKLPPAIRKQQIRTVLNAIEPTLYNRTSEQAKKHVNAGVPARTALQLSLAQSMSTGLAEEVIRVKSTRKPPKRSSLLGALGLVPHIGISPGAGSLSPRDGDCDGTGMIFRGGAWTRMSATDICTGQFYKPGPGGTPQTVCTADGLSILKNGQWVPRTASDICDITNEAGESSYKGRMLQVGPFTVPIDAKQFAIHWTGLLPPEWAEFISKELQHDCRSCTSLLKPFEPPLIPGVSCCLSSSMRPTVGHKWGIISDFLGAATPARVNQDFLSGKILGDDSKVESLNKLMYDGDVSNQNPIVFVQHPDTGDDYGFYIWIEPRDPSKPPTSQGGANPYTLILVWRQVERSWYKDAWNWIEHIVAKIIDIVKDVAGIACNLLADKNASSVPNPYVQAGHAVASGVCPPPPPPSPPGEKSLFLPLAIAGGVVLTAVLLSGKKKRSP